MPTNGDGVKSSVTGSTLDELVNKSTEFAFVWQTQVVRPRRRAHPRQAWCTKILLDKANGTQSFETWLQDGTTAATSTWLLTLVKPYLICALKDVGFFLKKLLCYVFSREGFWNRMWMFTILARYNNSNQKGVSSFPPNKWSEVYERSTKITKKVHHQDTLNPTLAPKPHSTPSEPSLPPLWVTQVDIPIEVQCD